MVGTFKVNRPNKFLAVLSELDILAGFLPPFIAKNVSLFKIRGCSYYLLFFFFFILCVQAYHDPMLKLSIMSEEELTAIFGDLDAYIPLHEGRYLTRTSYFTINDSDK